MSTIDEMKAVITLENYVVDKIDYKINESYRIEEEQDIDIDFDKEIGIDSENNKALLKLSCTLGDESNNAPFYLKVSLIGSFYYQSDLSKKEVASLLNINATAILFPYLRATISLITSNSGLTPFILPTININNFI